jgi:tRNA threonylcarbamoyladenosine biosynthesis protein TsaE
VEGSYESLSPEDTRKHASALAKKISRGRDKLPTLILLSGDLGAGKTEWVKGFVSSYLGSKVNVTSPTYSIVNAYAQGKKRLYHVDVYRLRGQDDLESVGFWDFLTARNVIIVEWGDKLPVQWPQEINLHRVDFKILSEDRRFLRLISGGGASLRT